MNNYTTDEEIELPPGFRFHPTDEELITHYLSPKVLQSGFCAKAIGEVDLNKVEPWDLPWRAKMGEREFYFFCVKDKKYPTGSRTNRATTAGYWKATGKDKEIYSGKDLVGMKKTLVFYKGRAPKGEKTNWVMHEYRLEGAHIYDLTTTPRNEWVISRIFRKTSGGQKIHISNLKGMGDHDDDQTRIAAVDASRLSSFPNPTEENKAEGEVVDSFINLLKFPGNSSPDAAISARLMSDFEFLPDQDCGTGRDQSILRYLARKDGCLKSELSAESEHSTGISWTSSGHETCQGLLDPYYSAGPVDLACLWNY